jgi:hypothetical protein
MGKSAATPPRINTNPAMQFRNISPHAIGKSGMAGGESSASPLGHDPAGIQHVGMGVVSKPSDPRTPPVYVGRDTPLSHGGPDGRKHFQGDPVSGEQKGGATTPAPSIGKLERGRLYGTQSADREGFAAPEEREVLKNEEAGPSRRPSPKQR